MSCRALSKRRPDPPLGTSPANGLALKCDTQPVWRESLSCCSAPSNRPASGSQASHARGHGRSFRLIDRSSSSERPVAEAAGAARSVLWAGQNRSGRFAATPGSAVRLSEFQSWISKVCEYLECFTIFSPSAVARTRICPKVHLAAVVTVAANAIFAAPDSMQALDSTENPESFFTFENLCDRELTARLNRICSVARDTN